VGHLVAFDPAVVLQVGVGLVEVVAADLVEELLPHLPLLWGFWSWLALLLWCSKAKADLAVVALVADLVEVHLVSSVVVHPA
jgi:hypothetical protein